jgi:UDP:flavonoid glycosyltransferase YjiC (YdhE family)
LTTIGSLGDLHPYVAIALGLRARRHEAIVATSECYRAKIEALDLGYRTLRPDLDWLGDPRPMRRIMDLRLGTMRALRDVVLPVLRESFEDTLIAAEGADLLIAHPLTYATRLVAEREGIAWVSSIPSPACLFSAHDPSLLPGVPDVSKALLFLGPAFWRPFGTTLRRATRYWAAPWYRFRAGLGLPRTNELNPLVDGHSPLLHLALFSRYLAAPQSDWPRQTVVTGFPFYDSDGLGGLPAALEQFLDAGPPPVVFTLGASSAAVAGRFFEHSVAAAKRAGRRAVLILKEPRNRPAFLPDEVVAFEYAPFSLLFPRASVIVHHGGIGTSGLAMQAGRPMLVVPHAHDQPDNAQRLARLGIARTLSRRRYHSANVVSELRRLLDDPAYSERASKVGQAVRAEDGVIGACDAIEELLQSVCAANGPSLAR